MHLTSQLAFDLDVESVPPAQAVIGRLPDGLPDRDREAAVQQMASLIAKYHVAGGPADDHA